MLLPLYAVATAIRPVPMFCSTAFWSGLIQSSFTVVLITLVTSLNINVHAWTCVHTFLVRISFVPVTGRPLAHSVRSLYAPLKCDFSCINMQINVAYLDASIRNQRNWNNWCCKLGVHTSNIHHITAVHPSTREQWTNKLDTACHHSIHFKCTQATVVTQDSPIYRHVFACALSGHKESHPYKCTYNCTQGVASTKLSFLL